jgi:hypothetical protein
MSVSRCMQSALQIAQTLPRAQWGDVTAALPEACPHSDCTGETGCRERVRDYLRTQYRMQARRDALRERLVRP